MLELDIMDDSFRRFQPFEPIFLAPHTSGPSDVPLLIFLVVGFSVFGFRLTIQNTANRHVSNAFDLLGVFISFPLARCCCCCGSCGFLLLLLDAPATASPSPEA
jgi:hypothetical protein